MESSNKEIKILVVDDDSGPLFFIEDILTAAEYSIVTANSGNSALRLIKQSMPDLLITDIVMDDGDGTNLILELRKISDIPVLAISGGNIGFGADYLEMALSFGANGILSKPFYRKELLDKVSRLLAKD